MKEVIVAQSNGIVMLTLNRPEKRNALHGHLIAELLQLIKNFSEDDAIRLLMINGNGEHFCAGADIAWMKKMAQSSPDENYQDAQLLSDLMYQLYTFPKLSMVLAHGATLGGGLGLLSVCDIAIAADNAKFGFSEVKIGIAPSVISPYVLSAIGARAASYYFLTGENFVAEEAKRIGLIHQCVADEKLISHGMEIAHQLLQNGPHALTAVKQLIRQVKAEPITKSLTEMTAKHLATLRTSSEAQEGLQAFLEKRKPNWS